MSKSDLCLGGLACCLLFVLVRHSHYYNTSPVLLHFSAEVEIKLQVSSQVKRHYQQSILVHHHSADYTFSGPW